MSNSSSPNLRPLPSPLSTAELLARLQAIEAKLNALQTTYPNPTCLKSAHEKEGFSD